MRNEPAIVINENEEAKQTDSLRQPEDSNSKPSANPKDTDSKSPKKDSRSRKYLLTINNPKNHSINHDSIKEALQKYRIRYLAICDEIGGETQTYHIHIFCYFENAIRFSSIKHMFPSANIQTAYGTSAQNRAYVLKSAPEHNKDKNGFYNYTDKNGKKHSGQNLTDTFEEIGDCPEERQGKRSDLEHLYTLVKDGYTDSEILDAIPETAIQHINKINRLRTAYLSDKFKGLRRLDLKVHYVTGKTGLGKSRDILDEYGDENVYRVTDYQHPFDSYQCETVLVFEEFRSSLRLSDMLNYLDIYPVTLPARYSPKIGCFGTVFVVSNWTFEQQYSEVQKDIEQEASYKAWIRRFNGCVKNYTDSGIITYPTIQDYLKRNETFHTAEEPTPFDTDSTTTEENKMPFED